MKTIENIPTPGLKIEELNKLIQNKQEENKKRNHFDPQPGEFYFHLKCHYVYIVDKKKRLVALCNGAILLPKKDERIKHNFYDFFRVALQDEIIRALTTNKNFHCLKTNRSY